MKNRKKSNLQKLYIKWIINNTFLFFVFLVGGLLLFIGLTISIKLDVMKTYPCYYANDSIILDKNYSHNGPTVYFYLDQNEKIYPIPMNQGEYKNGKYYISFTSNEILENKKGYLDVVIAKESLFERILGR